MSNQNQVTFKCPKCGNDKFWTKPRSMYAWCMKCGARVKRKDVPPEQLELRDEDVLNVPVPKTTARKKEAGVSLFERPKSPHEVLEEILRSYNINEDFIRIAVRRSKIMGGLHPTTLRQMLTTMKISGVKDRETLYSLLTKCINAQV